MRKAISFIILILFALGVIGYFLLPAIQARLQSDHKPSPVEEAQDLAGAKNFLSEDEPEKALEIIRKYDAYITPLTPSGKEWLNLLIQASEELSNVRQIKLLYEYFPEEFAGRESSSILIAQSYISDKRPEDYKELRSQWKGRETKTKEWLLLDADKLIIDGNKEQAIALLKSHTFKREEDTGRLLRLSSLVVAENPRESWGYLKEALEKDPDNPTIRLYRGKLLEAAGKDALALSEFVAAVQTKPESNGVRNQLADYFLRYHQYTQALEVWESAIDDEIANDSTLLKTWFWGRVTTPTTIDWQTVEISDGPLKAYLEYLISLGENQFWNPSDFDALSGRNRFIKNQQSSFWLRLIQSLQNGNEEQAIQLLKNNRFKERSWHPQLEVALERVLNYRKNGSLSIDTPVIPQEKSENETIGVSSFPFFEKLEEFAAREESSTNQVEIPKEIDAILVSDDAFGVTFLAGGWYEAAIETMKLSVIPETFPRWVAYGFTKAIEQNEGANQALKFATLQIPSPELSLLTSELLLANGNSEAALDNLKPLTRYDNVIGRKALWMISTIYINNKEYDKAKKSIQSNEELSQNVLGQELLARIAIMEGDISTAEKIYSTLLDKSAEAKSYFARKAYNEKNLPRARKLTEELLVEYPNSITIRKNLQKIIKEQKSRTIVEKSPSK